MKRIELQFGKWHVRGVPALVVALVLALALPCAVWILAMLAIVFGPSIETWWRSEDFRAEEWRAQEQPSRERWTPRSRMVGDLIDSERLIGLHRDEVIALLGVPSGDCGLGASTLCYYLGRSRSGYGQSLRISMDEGGVVVHGRSFWID